MFNKFTKFGFLSFFRGDINELRISELLAGCYVLECTEKEVHEGVLYGLSYSRGARKVCRGLCFRCTFGRLQLHI
jgi:hypothetical protein